MALHIVHVVMNPLLIILGIILLTGVSATSGYMFSRRDAFPAFLTPSETVSPAPSLGASSDSSPQSSFSSPAPSSPVVRGQSTGSPPLQTPTPSPSTVPSGDVRVHFVDLPAGVRSGQSFTIRWSVEGPQGALIEKTTLETRTATSSGSSEGDASSTSTTKNTFGSAAVPHTFSTTLKFGGDARSVTLTVNAVVNGAVVTAPSATLPIE